MTTKNKVIVSWSPEDFEKALNEFNATTGINIFATQTHVTLNERTTQYTAVFFYREAPTK